MATYTPLASLENSLTACQTPIQIVIAARDIPPILLNVPPRVGSVRNSAAAVNAPVPMTTRVSILFCFRMNSPDSRLFGLVLLCWALRHERPHGASRSHSFRQIFVRHRADCTRGRDEFFKNCKCSKHLRWSHFGSRRWTIASTCYQCRSNRWTNRHHRHDRIECSDHFDIFDTEQAGLS